MSSYKDLEIYILAMDLSLKIRSLSLKLESYDKFETGSQIRRSSQSIKDNIVDGYGISRYKADFIKFLIYFMPNVLKQNHNQNFYLKP